MSLLPFLFSAWLAGLDRPPMLMDQDFGLGLGSEDFRIPPWMDRYYLPQIRDRASLMDYYYRPWADLLRPDGNGKSTITRDKDKFKVTLDVQQFKPEEINVTVVDRVVVIKAEHKEKKDEHGLVSRQFVRKYCLPDQVDVEQVKSSISSDGVLTITAPIKEVPASEKKEKVIQIERTGKPAIQKDTEKPKETSTDTKNTEKEKEVPTKNVETLDKKGEKQDQKGEKQDQKVEKQDQKGEKQNQKVEKQGQKVEKQDKKPEK